MCGIVGFVDTLNRTSPGELDAMRDRLAHRGPDDRGSAMVSRQSPQVGFGHRRLSILDLSMAGHQPMVHGAWTIVFNGEVYNFGDLASRYENGEPYRSHSDTEVVLRAMATDGPEACSRFVGMFSLAAWDADTATLLLARDRTGIKPLYYYRDGDLLLFASEPKAFFAHGRFRPEINPDALTAYLQTGYLTGGTSIYAGVQSVPPGSVLRFSLHDERWDQPETICYWGPSGTGWRAGATAPADGIVPATYADARAELDGLMREAFSLRMVSDVPVGVFLSGGYDSTAVAALLTAAGHQELETFTIGFRGPDGPDPGDEAPHARAIADHLGTRHRELYFSTGDALEIARHLPETFDEPFADTSAIPTLLLSRFTREHVTVSLSADAGDETFAGYGRYRRALELWNRNRAWPGALRSLAAGAVAGFPWRALARTRGSFDQWQRAMRFAGVLQSTSSLDALRVLSRQYQPSVARTLLAPALRDQVDQAAHAGFLTIHPGAATDASDLQRMLTADYHAFLMEDVLVKVDRATMAYSLEGRDPLMDHRIFEYAAALPDEWKLRDLGGKHILKDIVHQYVPRDLVDRPKQGFSPPMTQWLRGELRPVLERATRREWLAEQGIFDPDLVSRMGRAFLSGSMNNPRQMWIIVAFQMWYDRWIAR